LTARLDPARTRALLLDIEGTSTPVDFVYLTLFPFARARVGEFLDRHHASNDVAAEIEVLRRERDAEANHISGVPPWREDTASERTESAAAFVRWLIDHDRKLTALKSLQGRIWEAGYRSGELRGPVYPDVPPAFARWRRQGRTIAIFSSGSVLAQKLLFTHSTAGDLTSFIGGYFDTTTGPKKEETSYLRIAAALSLAPGQVLYVSDVVAELDAARRTGMQTALCVRGETREASACSDTAAHPVVHSFDPVFP
jgi:enolase-phosphatase E1